MNMLIIRKIAVKQGYPKYFEGDLICNRCGEPWDAYGVRHDDMTKEEAEIFLRGGGCPCCTSKNEGR